MVPWYNDPEDSEHNCERIRDRQLILSVMGKWMLLCLVLATFSVSFLSTVESVHFEGVFSVCNNVKSVDPTILDLISKDIAPKIEKYLSIDEDVLNNGVWSSYGLTYPYYLLMSAFSFKMPILSFISYGYFRVEYQKPVSHFSFNDIYIIHENYASLNMVCNTFGKVLGPLAPFCRCWNGVAYPPLPDGTDTYYHPAQWCYVKPLCSDKTLETGYCDVPTDPLRTSCILLDVIKDPTNQGLSEDTRTMLDQLVTYHRVVPTVDRIWSSVTTAFPALQNDWLTTANAYFTRMLSYFPTHLVVFLLGVYVVCNARELAEDDTFQLFMVGLYGLLLAFVFLLYGMYRMSEQLMRRYGGPLPSFIHIPVLISMGSFLFTSPSVPAIILQGALAFWESGAPFGVWWLGKAYFALSIAGSFYLSWAFSLFRADSKSWHVMHYTVKLMGLVLLAYSTASSELSIVLMLLGMFPENLSHFAWTLYLMAVTWGQTPTYKYLGSGKKMSMIECEQLSRSHTAKHLQKLKTHLQSPENLHKYTDRFRESGKDTEMKLIGRFAEGTYPGVPYTVPSEVEPKSGARMITVIVAVSVVLVAAGAFYRNAV